MDYTRLLSYSSKDSIKGTLILDVIAEDETRTPRSTEAQVIITVVDENNHAPEFEQSAYSTFLVVNSSPDELITLKASDLDTGDEGRISYSISNVRVFPRNVSVTNDLFAIDNMTGVFSSTKIFTSNSKVERYQVIVAARDNGVPALQSTATLDVSVLPADYRQGPRFYPEVVFTSLPSTGNQAVVSVSATTKKLNSSIRYSSSSGRVNGIQFLVEEGTGIAYLTVTSAFPGNECQEFTVVCTDFQGIGSVNAATVRGCPRELKLSCDDSVFFIDETADI